VPGSRLPSGVASCACHGERAGIDRPALIVDERAEHLDDLYRAALTEGASEGDARAQSPSRPSKNPT
jgi:hypothetical protein